MVKSAFKKITIFLNAKTLAIYAMILFPVQIFAESRSNKIIEAFSSDAVIITANSALFLTLISCFVLININFKKKFEAYKQEISHIANESAGNANLAAAVEEAYAFDNTLDMLTLLPNRRQLFNHLQEVVDIKHDAISKYAVIIVNLDFFRSVNNNLGYEVGDKILLECSNRLKTLYQGNAYIARMDGDEFAVVLRVINTNELSSAADNLLELMKKPIKVVEQDVYLSVSLGISIFPDHGTSAEELIKNANTALNIVKNTRRNSYKMFSPEAIECSHQKFNLHSELRQAIENNEFVLHYQPKVSSKTSEIVGIEALVRWNHPTRGLLYPIDFIPIAEETGIIKYIDEWVLHTACLQLNKWLQEGITNIRLAVNLSAWQFKDHHLVDTVVKVLEETGIPPSHLELEITETAALENLSFTQNILAKLMDMGITISIDDFGTGYSSLNYLKYFPISFLKIDKSFVADILDDKNTFSIVRAIIDVAHALQLKVIAEGVENQDQFDVLMNLDCDEIQGYHISRPVNVDDIKRQMTKVNRA